MEDEKARLRSAVETILRAEIVRGGIGSVIRKYRCGRKQTLAEMAAEMGIAVPYLSDIERNQRPLSENVLSALEKICR